jgi:hypothetical protein
MHTTMTARFAQAIQAGIPDPAALAKRFLGHWRAVEARGEPSDGKAGSVAFYYATTLVSMAAAPAAVRLEDAVWKAQERTRLLVWSRHGWPEYDPATGDLWIPEEHIEADLLPADYVAWSEAVAGDLSRAERSAFRETCEALGAADLADLAEGDPAEYERRRLLGLRHRVERQLRHHARTL